MKYKLKIADKNSSIFKSGFVIKSFKQSKKANFQFIGKIGNKNSSRKIMRENLINLLKNNGWKYNK